MLHTILAQVGASDNFSDSTVGISLVSQSVQLSQQTAEAWEKTWGQVVTPNGALWSGLCNLGTVLAALSILLVSLKMASDYQEGRFYFSELAASVVWPLGVWSKVVGKEE